MKWSRRLPVLLGVGLILAALIVGSGLAQAPDTGSEPSVPIHASEGELPHVSSQAPTQADSAVFEESAMELTEAQRNSSAPILPDGEIAAPASVPGPAEDLLRGADKTAALVNLRIPGTALKPRNSNATYVPTGGGGCFYSTASAYTCFNIGVYLPQGSRIDTMRMYYSDSNASDSTAWFTVYDLYGNIVQEWAVSSAGNSGNGFNDTALIDHVVNYSLYSYAINWRPYVLGNTMQNCGFRFFYQPPAAHTFLPAVRNDP